MDRYVIYDDGYDISILDTVENRCENENLEIVGFSLEDIKDKEYFINQLSVIVDILNWQDKKIN